MNTRSDIEMEGVRMDVSLLSVRETLPISTSRTPRLNLGEDELMRYVDGDGYMNFDEDDDNSMVPGLCEDDGSDIENDDDDDDKHSSQQQQQPQQQVHDHDITAEVLDHDDNNDSIATVAATVAAMAESLLLSQAAAEQSSSAPSSSSSSPSSSTSSLQPQPSIISIPEAVYTAVPVSSELYIIPHSSKGFRWNDDLFMKAQQRQTLGVDEMYQAEGDSSLAPNGPESSNGGPNGVSRGGAYPYDSVVSIHEIRLDEDESKQILPS
ncbi:hypothetical protein B0O80DRAFT_499272 [Mortierella sp. GBAus27b]|nr:hypothetical protein BGX31_001172 [Mortierella sp. GBA43]KAI8352563.1 hypothetical protein B0O80DRAFT_499272 [Mortierella sp. GBAus27b]